MKRPLSRLFLLLSLLMPAAGVWAQGFWRDLPPEDRRQMRQQMREQWQQEREIRREEGGPPRWRDLPPEDRRQLREDRSEEHTSELQSHHDLVCRLLLEKKKKKNKKISNIGVQKRTNKVEQMKD